MNSISINPPPADGRCECCGKEMKDLKPFGKAGDPLNGDFNGALLVKTFRSLAPPIKDKDYLEFEDKYAEAGTEGKLDWDNFEDDLIKKFGKKKATEYMNYAQLAGTISASWECRDCICLYDEEWFKKLGEKNG